MKFDLDKKHIFYSDSMNMWITKKVARKKRDGTGEREYEELVSGYHQDLDHLLESLFLRKVRGIDKTKLEDINKEIAQYRKEVVKFSKEISKKIMNSREGE